MIQPPTIRLELAEGHDWKLQLEVGAAIHQLGPEPLAPKVLQRWTAVAIGFTSRWGDALMAPRIRELYTLLVDDFDNEQLHQHQRPPAYPTPALSRREAAKFHVAMDRLDRLSRR